MHRRVCVCLCVRIAVCGFPVFWQTASGRHNETENLKPGKWRVGVWRCFDVSSCGRHKKQVWNHSQCKEAAVTSGNLTPMQIRDFQLDYNTAWKPVSHWQSIDMSSLPPTNARDTNTYERWGIVRQRGKVYMHAYMWGYRDVYTYHVSVAVRVCEREKALCMFNNMQVLYAC